MGKYDKIIDLPHHQSKKHPQMPLYDRAAQFAPFAALTGYDDLVEETARVTDEKIELGESQREVLDRQQAFIAIHINEKPLIEVTYFVADTKKSGGKYVVKSGNLKRIDDYSRVYIFTDFRQHPIMRGESFIFFPVPYYLFVLSMRMIELLYSDKARNELPCYGSFSTIANKGLAALSLLEDNFLDNAYPICRGIIETYVKLVVLMNKPEAISSYNKFSKWNFMFWSRTLQYSLGTTFSLSIVTISRSDCKTVLSGANTRALWQYLVSLGYLFASKNS